MFWGSFSYDRRSPLWALEADPTCPAGGVGGRRILGALQACLPGMIEPGFSAFMHDNAKTFRSAVVQDWLNPWATENDVELMDWPAYSPDLNPIENIWKLVKERLHKADPELASMPSNAVSLDRLIRGARDAWESIEKEVLENLVDSMPRQCAAVIEARGWYTKY